eukprot:3254695-Prymnesium_polylepis.1
MYSSVEDSDQFCSDTNYDHVLSGYAYAKFASNMLFDITPHTFFSERSVGYTSRMNVDLGALARGHAADGAPPTRKFPLHDGDALPRVHG